MNKLIAFRIFALLPRGTGFDPIVFNDGFTSVTSPDVGRLIFTFNGELLSDEFINAASLQKSIFEKPEDAVEVKFEEINRSTTGFELQLYRVEEGNLIPYDSPLVCVVTIESA